MPLYESNITVSADRTATFAVTGERFREQIAISLADDLEPHCVIVILLDVGNLDVANNFSVIHHGEASWPTVVVHTRFRDVYGAADGYASLSPIFVNFCVAGVCKSVAVLFHEGYLLFQFVGGPEVIAIEEGYPLALCLMQGTVPGNGGTALFIVFEVADSRVWILRLRLRSTQDDTLNDFVGVIGAGVVNDNQFPVGVSLGYHGIDGFRDVFAGIVARHDYGDQT